MFGLKGLHISASEAIQGYHGHLVVSCRWLRLLRPTKLSKVVAIVVDSVSSAELEMFPDCLPTLRQAFDFVSLKT